MSLTFSAKDVCRIAGISYRQLEHWRNSNLLVTPTRGSGVDWRATEQDLYRAIELKVRRDIIDALVTESGLGMVRTAASYDSLRRVP